MMPPRNEENHPWAAHPLAGSSQIAIPQATNRKTPAPRRSRIFFTSFTKFFFSPSFSSFGYPTRHESSPQKLSHNVVQCRAKSRDAHGNMCYNVDCQRRTKEHTLPGATRTQKVVTERHQKSRDRRVNTCYNANW